MLPPKQCASHQSLHATAGNICRSRLYYEPHSRLTIQNHHWGFPWLSFGTNSSWLPDSRPHLFKILHFDTLHWYLSYITIIVAIVVNTVTKWWSWLWEAFAGSHPELSGRILEFTGVYIAKASQLQIQIMTGLTQQLVGGEDAVKAFMRWVFSPGYLVILTSRFRFPNPPSFQVRLLDSNSHRDSVLMILTIIIWMIERILMILCRQLINRPL